MFVKQVEAYIVALEHFRIVVNRVPELLADSTWEERDALAEEVRAAEGAARAARPYRFDRDDAGGGARGRAAGREGAPKEWAVAPAAGRADTKCLVGLGRWLTGHPPPPPTDPWVAAPASTSPVAE